MSTVIHKHDQSLTQALELVTSTLATGPYTPGIAHIRIGLVHLKFARDHFRAAGARMTLDRVRLAIKSAEGAERHQTRLERERMEVKA
jgi:hypothetical protein